jgi:hypothetical protein
VDEGAHWSAIAARKELLESCRHLLCTTPCGNLWIVGNPTSHRELRVILRLMTMLITHESRN